MTPRADSSSRTAAEGAAWPFVVQVSIVFLIVGAIQATRPMVTYRAIELGASPLEIGLVQSAFSILPVLTAVLLGRWVDRVGELKVLTFGCLAVAVGAVIAAGSASLATLAVAQLAMGFGLVGQAVAGQALVANRGSVEGRLRRYGWWSVAASLGQLVGPPIAALLVVNAASGTGIAPFEGLSAGTGNTHEPVFLFAAVAAATAVVLTLLLPYRTPIRRPDAGDGRRDSRLLTAVARVLRRKGMAPAMVNSIAVSVAMDVLLAYLPALGVANGLGVGTIGLLLAVRAGASLFSRVLLGPLSDAIGVDRLLVASTALAAIGILGLPFTASVPVLVFLMALIGIGLGLGQPMVVAWVSIQSAPEERGLALGIRLTGNLAAQLAFLTLMGALAGAIGLDLVWVSMAALLALGAIGAWLSPFSDRPAPDERAPAGA